MRLQHFILIALVSFILTSCQSATEAEADKSENRVGETSEALDRGFKGEEVEYMTDSVTMKGYIAYPIDKALDHPGILIVHEWWGHNDYVRRRADSLAALGYTALALDMYGEGKQASHPSEAGEFAGMVMSNIDLATSRFDAGLRVLKEHPSVNKNSIAAIGYCFGGSVVLSMADAGKELDAVAAFHSGVELPIMPTKDLKARVLVCNGADDPFISEESVKAFEHQLDSVGADYEYIAYAGAVHAFTNPDATEMGKKFELPLAYDKEADDQSWNELKKMLAEVF